jgi:hypothetical protein
MCVMGYFIAFSQIGWWWRWLRYIAVHYYNFSTFSMCVKFTRAQQRSHISVRAQ